MTHRSFGILGAVFALGLAASPLLGQNPIVIRNGQPIELPPGVVLPPGVDPAAVAAAVPPPGAVPAAVSPEAKELQDLLKLKFDRSPASILKVMAAEARDDEPSTNKVERFQLAVVLGDWNEVGEFLGTLSETNAPKLFEHVLKQLAVTAPARPKPTPGAAPRPPASKPTDTGTTLSPDDLLALSDAAPRELTREQVKLLGALLKQILDKGDYSEPLLVRLREGVKHLGGDERDKSELAAALLLEAGHPDKAVNFLKAVGPERGSAVVERLELHARCWHAKASAKPDDEEFQRAWLLNQLILDEDGADQEILQRALERSLEMLASLPKQTGVDWLAATFRRDRAKGLAILAAIGEQVAANLSNRAAAIRENNLKLQRTAVDTLLGLGKGELESWTKALNLLARHWAHEAEYAVRLHRPTQTAQRVVYDAFGNPQFYNYPSTASRSSSQIPGVNVAAALESAPNEAWISRLEPTLIPRVRFATARLRVNATEIDEALALIESLAEEHPRPARELAGELLRAWATAKNPNSRPSSSTRYGPFGPVYSGSPYGSRGGMSLTRAKQQRNLRELGGLVAALNRLPFEQPVDESALVTAFTSAHSQAEVYRVEDIEAVFGELDAIEQKTLSGLLQNMREKLASQWRSPKVQEAAKTQRKDRDIEAEVLRGYDIVRGMINRALSRESNSWRLHMVKAAALYDLAEFQYGKKIDLAVYVEKRDNAFVFFEKAAALYAMELPELDREEETPEVYRNWFNANLGASDLAYLTRQTEPSTNNLQIIREALLALPGEAADRHRSAFAKRLAGEARLLKPQLKARYFRSAMRVVGDHADAEEIRKLVRYYDDLVGEIELSVRVDGDAEVGHGKPFGVFVGLRHTASIERESGGFGRYLYKPQQNPYYLSSRAPQRSFRDEFEDQVREKLADGFEIQTVTFHDDKIKSRGYGRNGWRETPLAYLMLEAKDAAVDQIPALRMDLDFVDSAGPVALPVRSQIILLDARPPDPPTRPLHDIEITQVLDDREVEEGRLTLELKATGKGLLPDFKSLLNLSLPGLKVEGLEEQGVAIATLDVEGEEVAPVSERSALLRLGFDQNSKAPAKFEFPQARIASAALTFKRYDDADLVEVEPAVALAGVPLRETSPWRAVLILLLFAAAAVAAFLLRRQDEVETTATPNFCMPDEVSPFSIIKLLRAIAEDERVRLPDERKAELAKAIDQIEKSYFGRAKKRSAPADLKQVASEWLATANG